MQSHELFNTFLFLYFSFVFFVFRLVAYIYRDISILASGCFLTRADTLQFDSGKGWTAARLSASGHYVYQLPNYIGNRVIPSEVQLLQCCRKLASTWPSTWTSSVRTCIRCLGSC